jgi:hypothetical protein
MYIIEWGDNTSEWTEYGDSGEEFKLKHIWNAEGNYIIKAKAIDIDSAESNWSEFKVNIPRNKAISNDWYNFILEHFPILERLLDLLR